MKKHLYILSFAAIGFAACGPVYVVHQDPPPAQAPAPLPPPPPQVDPPEVTYQNFYDDLSPYGQWIDDPNYGYVWLPDVGPDFKPYATNGHWVYTDEGWAWDSGYPWGWAAFHYGRWFFQDGYGWMWVPGNEWAPAWVSWRNSDEYYGWAPMGPSVSYGAAYGGGYAPPPYYWSFVPHRYIASPQVNNYYVRETNNVTIINRTTVINNTTIINNTRNVRYSAGPDAGEVGRYSGASVRPMSIRNGRNPGDRSDNGSFTVYRPRVNGAVENRPGSASYGGRQIAPARVQSLGNARPVNRTVYGNGSDNRGNDNRGNDNRGYDNRGNGNGWGRDNNGNANRGNDNRGNDNRGNGNSWGRDVNGNNNGGNDNRGNGNNGNDNRGNGNNGNDNRGNGNAWGRDNNNNNRTNNGFPNRGGYPQGNQPANQPVQNQPAQNQPTQNQPAQNPPRNNPFGRPV
ncbi:MAG: hypothetical protein JST42_29930, partial [Bacteroidetes bacterium]|nr:hypothetical protein [Bacteroidota bacterium]